MFFIASGIQRLFFWHEQQKKSRWTPAFAGVAALARRSKPPFAVQQPGGVQAGFVSPEIHPETQAGATLAGSQTHPRFVGAGASRRIFRAVGLSVMESGWPSLARMANCECATVPDKHAVLGVWISASPA